MLASLTAAGWVALPAHAATTTTATLRVEPLGDSITYGSHINGGGTANGTTVQLWDCNGGTNQHWTLPS